MATKPELLIPITLLERWHGELEDEFTVRYVGKAADRAAAIRAVAPRIGALATNSTGGASRELIASLPKLEIIALFSVGYEGVDLAAAAERGIPVTNAPGVNAGSVADLALGLMLAGQREIPLRDRQIRTGRFADTRALTHTLDGKRLGLLGLGNIGRAVATRAAAFGMTIGYLKPTRAADSAYRYFESAEALAAASDFLVVCSPGGPLTRHLVNARVLNALGSEGYLVNVARGSIVDTAALVDALERGTIAGAALDVYDNEPEVPEALRRLDNVVLMPHVGGFTHEAFRAAFELLRENLRAHFAGRPLLTPVTPARELPSRPRRSGASAISPSTGAGVSARNSSAAFADAANDEKPSASAYIARLASAPASEQTKTRSAATPARRTSAASFPGRAADARDRPG